MLLDEEHVETYKKLCDELISGVIDASTHRIDLGSHGMFEVAT